MEYKDADRSNIGRENTGKRGISSAVLKISR